MRTSPVQAPGSCRCGPPPCSLRSARRRPPLRATPSPGPLPAIPVPVGALTSLGGGEEAMTRAGSGQEYVPATELLAEQLAGVRELMGGAWQAAPGFVRQLEAAGVAPGD